MFTALIIVYPRKYWTPDQLVSLLFSRSHEPNEDTEEAMDTMINNDCFYIALLEVMCPQNNFLLMGGGETQLSFSFFSGAQSERTHTVLSTEGF